jgi:prephenate dehydrogenase
LKTGCVVLDTADVKAPVMGWAAALLPKDVHFVGGHPIVMVDRQNLDAARADLFDHKIFCLTPNSTTNDTAVRLAADVAEALGAQPYFLDAAEHDGLVAAVEQFPMLLAGALMSLTVGSPGWTDMRKLAATQFFAATLITAGSSKEAISSAAANRDNVLHWLDDFIVELNAWREEFANGNHEDLVKGLEDGLVASQKWLAAQSRGVWDQEPAPQDLPTTGSTFRDMFLGRLFGPGERPKRK